MYRIVVLLFALVIAMAKGNWDSQCGRCKCVWADGKKTADCKSLDLKKIPTDLSSEVRDIDFSNNPLGEIMSNAFADANLHDTHKLRMQNCNIEYIHEKALASMNLLIELDLSRNNIQILPVNLFQESGKLRNVYLNFNRILNLRSPLFFNLTHLQKLEVNHNQITFIDEDVFERDKALKHLDLSFNNLTSINFSMIENLGRLVSLNIENNPLICDCRIRKFMEFSLKRSLITSRVECDKPDRLRHRNGNDIPLNEFACPPNITYVAPISPNVEINTNYTLVCQVEGNPLPDVNWKLNDRIIDRDPHPQSYQKYKTTEEKIGQLIWRNLTIINFIPKDNGEYKCEAKNPGGSESRAVKIYVNAASDKGASSAMMPWIIGLSIGAIVLFIIIIVLICYCLKCTGSRQAINKAGDASESGDYICLNGRQDSEKAIITDVNPISKPPRHYSVPPSVTSGVTEVNDVKKTLLDNDSMGVGDEESRSFDHEPHIQSKYVNHLDVDYRAENQLTPDLLAFPVGQASPAGSTASTVLIDHARLPAYHAPQSPLHSPHYEAVYPTIPYSRSQSPFTTPLGPPVVGVRPGYVTIPRRPRASWSSEPPTFVASEPVYDNLGLRTTASGSSALSLNKLSDAGTPKLTRPGNPCDTIAEQETGNFSATLPRIGSAQRALSPVNNYRTLNSNNNRLRIGSDTSSLRNSSETPDSRRESTASLLPSSDSASGKVAKTPPRPPPKPKKRTSTGPLFEDEGEHGTEV